MTRSQAFCALLSILQFLACGAETTGDTPIEGAQALQSVWIELGRHLFYERRLSLNEDRSCGICHEQAKGFTDGFVRAVGTTEEIHPRNTLSLINVSHRSSLGWISQEHTSLESQLLIPLLGDMPVEMGLSAILYDRLEELNADPTYQAFLSKLKLSKLTLDHIQNSIAQFERTLTSDHSPYDDYISGNKDALSPSAQRGLSLFTEVLSCGSCHGGRDFDQPESAVQDLDAPLSSTALELHHERHGWFNTGLYHLDGGRYPPQREGLYERTSRTEDIGKYRVPTLRNLAFTAPYYHDGSGASIDDVLDNYNLGGRVTRSGPYIGDGRDHPNKHPLIRPLELSSEDLNDLKAFLLSLTDQSIIHEPHFSDPWQR